MVGKFVGFWGLSYALGYLAVSFASTCEMPVVTPKVLMKTVSRHPREGKGKNYWDGISRKINNVGYVCYRKGTLQFAPQQKNFINKTF